jgi:hypothetical protein
VVERPDEPDATAALRLQLRKLLEADPELAAELAELVEEGRRTGVLAMAAGSRSARSAG